jgi:hypothetical protein
MMNTETDVVKLNRSKHTETQMDVIKIGNLRKIRKSANILVVI